MGRTLIAFIALSACMPAMAEGRTLADHCMAQVTRGAVVVYRDVDVLASGRDRIAYFRCVRAGMLGSSSQSAFAGWYPNVTLATGNSITF